MSFLVRVEAGWCYRFPARKTAHLQRRVEKCSDAVQAIACSAFHTTMFRFVDRKATNIYMATEGAHSNYDMIDNLMGNTSRYIVCIFPVSESSKTLELNYQKAIEGLDEISIAI